MEMEDRISFNWKDLFVKVLFLVAFFLILLWLYPNNNLTTFYDKVYNANVQTMKEAAKSYYTVERLPKSGSSKRMTLDQMEDVKMILPFLDKDGKRCDVNDSYVEVTRLSSQEYALKVSLTCGKQSDYIIDTIGCYDVCEGGNCGNNTIKPNDESSSQNDGNNQIDDKENNISNPDKDNGSGDKDVDEDNQVGDKDLDGACTATEYEYKRSKKEVTYGSCPNGYIKNGKYCTKSMINEVMAATLVAGKTRKIVTDAKVNPGKGYKVYAEPTINTKYICGSEYDNAGTYTVPTKCIKTSSAIAEAVRKDTYTCSSKYANPGSYTVYTKCYGSDQKTDEAVKKTEYICGTNYDNAGTYTVPTTCKKVITDEKKADAKTTYTCSTAYDNAGTYTTNTICYKNNRVNEAAKLTSQVKTYTCSTAYDNAGTYKVPTTCTKTTVETKTSPLISSTTTYECSSYYDNAGTYTAPTTCRKSYKTYANSEAKTTSGYYRDWNCGTCSTKKYTSPQYSTSTTKYDPRGTATEYICSGTNCPGYVKVYYYVVYTRSWVAGKTTYECSSYYDNAGTYSSSVQCYKTHTTTATAPGTTKNVYECSSIYDNAGKYSSAVTCKKTIKTSAPAPEKVTNTYTCDSSFINAGTYTVPTTCYKDVKTTANSVAKTTYTCSSIYDNAGTYNVPTTCKKVNLQTAEAVAKDSYTCSSKYQNAGTYNIPTKCVYSAAYADEPSVDIKYVCDNTYDNAGVYKSPTKCIRKGSINVTPLMSQIRSCPKGYTESGTICYKTVKSDDTHYCSDANATLVGKTCEKTVKGKSVYKCPKGMILSYGKCYEFKSTTIELKEEDCKETTEYIWSPTETLEGWERTGETRKTNVRCPVVTDCTKKENSNVIQCPTQQEEDFFGGK